MEDLETQKDDETISTPLTLFLEYKRYTQYTTSRGSTDECLQEMMRYEACSKERTGLFPLSESSLHVLEIIWFNRALKGRVTKILVDCSSAQ